ncbi:Ig-like domain-containing protein [Limnoraphis robusta CCNP1324]|uniref:Ig-like domain-containing protein n=1 Tax=Limnoraphis robusta TaxID=1118279 RepID=UPI002B1F368D|nr:Ig-like domain-containing protein [Limnoraphis robusta]MEA5543719.1 Ig-like domain-containing protein [Limnoraphis robusta CCNP1324]
MAITIGITADPSILIEDEGSATTITFNVEGEIPDDGVVITLDNDIPFALGDFNILIPPPEVTGGQIIRGNADNSGFDFRILDNTATIILPIFDDDDLPPNDPNFNRNNDIGVEETTFFLVENDAYSIDANASQITLNLADTASQLNSPPVADNDDYTTPFETVLTVNLTEGIISNDIDDDGDELTATLITEPSNGSLTFNPDGTFNYTPNLDFTGSDSFTYQVNDGTDNSNIATVNLTVGEAPNIPPVATDDNYTTPFETVLTVNLTEGIISNDIDDDGDELTATLITEPSNGSLTFNLDGTFNYTPNLDFTGSDSFTYQVNDGTDNSNIATVNLTVEEPPNIPPNIPTVSLTATPETLIETESTELTFNFELSEPPAQEGITVILESNTPQGFTQFDLSNVNSSGIGNINDVSPNEDFFAFAITILEQNASISLPIFQDVLDEEEQVISFQLVESENYNLAEDYTPISITFIDENPDDSGENPDEDIDENPDDSGENPDEDIDENPDDSGENPDEDIDENPDDSGENPDEDIDENPDDLGENPDEDIDENPDDSGENPDEDIDETPDDSTNQPPVLTTPISDQAGLQQLGFSLNISQNFSDPENDLITYSVTGLPANLDFDSNSGLIVGIPTQPGQFNVTVTASDSQANQIQDSFELLISPFVVPQLPPIPESFSPEPELEAEPEPEPIIPIEIELPTPELNSEINSEIFGDLEDNELIGTEENDALFGNQGNDSILGLEKDDNLFGGEDDDRIIGGLGNDVIFGEKGNDSLFGDDPSSGNSQRRDFIIGGEGDDLIFGNQDEDTLIGEEGNDSFYGGKGDDLIFGGEGDDFLSGDAGNDTLIGGLGRDKFMLSTGQGTDTIVGFEAGTDSFELAGELTFDQLRTTQQNGLTQIRLLDTDEILAVLDVEANKLDISPLENEENPNPENDNDDQDEPNDDNNNQPPENPSDNGNLPDNPEPEDELIQVSFSASPNTLIETEGTRLNFEFSLNQPPPEDGLRVFVDSDLPRSLTQLDLTELSYTGGESFPTGDFDFTGFAFTITEQTASISVPIFDDSSLPPEESEEGAVPVTYRLLTRNGISSQDLAEVEASQSISEYLIDPSLNSSTIIFADSPESLV